MIYSGTGSTAWAKSAQFVSFDRFSDIVKMADPSLQCNDKILEMYERFQQSEIFSPQENHLKFLHRELFIGKLLEKVIERARCC
jgi:hypothetical protein